MLWEFKNNKNATETTKKLCSIYVQDVITDRQVWNWFSKFRSGDISLRDKPRPGHSSDFHLDILRELVKSNLCKSTRKLALDQNTSQSTIFCHLKNIGKVSKLSV